MGNAPGDLRRPGPLRITRELVGDFASYAIHDGDLLEFRRRDGESARAYGTTSRGERTDAELDAWARDFLSQPDGVIVDLERPPPAAERGSDFWRDVAARAGQVRDPAKTATGGSEVRPATGRRR